MLTLCINLLCFVISQPIIINRDTKTISSGEYGPYVYVRDVTYDLNSKTVYVKTDHIFGGSYE